MLAATVHEGTGTEYNIGTVPPSKKQNREGEYSHRPLWHKDNMINLGVENLLPEDCKAFAWIDADLDFESHSWALDKLQKN